jgi:hypothetical protein
MDRTAVPPEILAAGLAARLLHDLSAPAHGIVSGLDLLGDPGDRTTWAEGVDLAGASARSLLGRLDFCRAAYGGAAGAMDGRALEALARTPFADRRPRLEWAAAATPFSAPAVQALLILLQIAADALATGGVARVTAQAAVDRIAIRVEGEGAGARFHPETLEGLAGRASRDGLAGRWAPAFHAQAVIARAGGGLEIARRAGGFRLEAVLPGPPADGATVRIPR